MAAAVHRAGIATPQWARNSRLKSNGPRREGSTGGRDEAVTRMRQAALPQNLQRFAATGIASVHSGQFFVGGAGATGAGFITLFVIM